MVEKNKIISKERRWEISTGNSDWDEERIWEAECEAQSDDDYTYYATSEGAGYQQLLAELEKAGWKSPEDCNKCIDESAQRVSDTIQQEREAERKELGAELKRLHHATDNRVTNKICYWRYYCLYR